jgi:general secretion pathway protein D
MMHVEDRMNVLCALRACWTSRARQLAAILAVTALLAGCAASRAFNRGTDAVQAGEWDVAVQQYEEALQREPGNVRYRIALQRALVGASLYWAEQGRVAEARGEFDVALRAYRRANDYDPTNGRISARVSEMERRVRGQDTPPGPTVQQLQTASQVGGPPPMAQLNELVDANIAEANAREVLTSLGTLVGINVVFERDFPPNQPVTVQLSGVTFEEALNQIMAAYGFFYKVLNERTIMVIQDTQPKRIQFDDQIVRVLRLSYADATEVVNLINTVIRVPGNLQQGTFQAAPNKTLNTITYRASASVASIIERVVAASDKPRAEIIVDVEILEVTRTRVKEYGLDLGNYTIGAVVSPEADPGTDAGLAPQPFSLDALTRGIGQDELFFSVPAAAVRFLESDAETRVLAKPQLRGAEGQQLTLDLGEEIPIPETVFTPLAQGGANFQPLSSFSYRTVGIIVTMTPRVTYTGEIILDLEVENSTRGPDVDIGGSNLPTFSTRRVTTQLRLRDGEPNLLAGLIQESERRSLRGIPGILRLPIIKQLFSANEQTIQDTDIIILLTPRIVRTHEITPADLEPIVMRTPAILGLGEPPVIVQPPAEPGAAQPAAPPGGAPAPAPPAPPPPQGAAPPAADPAAAGAGVAGRILLTPNALDLRAGTDGLMVPVTADVSRLSRVSLTVTYNPAVLRVRTVQQGSFLSAGGSPVTFTEDHAAPGRVDIVMMRTGDQTGAAGVGQLAALLFDTIGPGTANLAVTGSAAAPTGEVLPVQFVQPPTVTVK